MKTISISTLALIAALGLAGGAFAQDPPSGGPDAKGNAPIKHVHTVNDGTAKKGANSFTQNEARKHILNSGYSDVSGLTKDKDGVWRGTATKDGSSRSVALDFKGNVSEGVPAQAVGVAPPMAQPMGKSATTAASAPATGSTDMGAAPTHHAMHRHHRRHHHHHLMAKCAHPGPNDVACSGRDRNMNGISDKEDRALKAGAKP